MSAAANLPAAAKAKLARLVQIANDAQALARAALAQAEAQQHRVGRILRNEAPLGERRAEETDATKVAQEADAAERELARLQEVHAERNRRYRDAGQLVVRLEGYLAGLPQSTTFDAVRVARPEPNGEQPRAAVDRLRKEIVSIKREMAQVSRAPISAEEARVAVRAEVDRLAKLGRPRLTADRARLQIEYRPPGPATLGGGAFSTGMTAQDVMAKMAWLMPAIVEDAMMAEVAAMDLAGSMTTEDRGRRRGELRAALDTAEREEERIIDAAAAQGHDVPRRPDAAPLAVLAIKIVDARAQAA